jgi:type IV pilus assembly protein PilN
MYSIDINLLNDRPEYSQVSIPQPGRDSEDKTPMLLGAAFGGGLLGLVLIAFGAISLLNQQFVSREQDLDEQLEALTPQLAEVDNLQAQEQRLKAETQALATIFNQIKPWSALLRDLGERVPPDLQLTKIEQTATPISEADTKQKGKSKAATATVAPLKAPSDLKIFGSSLQFDGVNDFVLTLRKSPFLNGNETQLISSKREVDKESEEQLVTLELKTQINDVPAAELLPILNAKGARGLAIRLEDLRKKGVSLK